MRIPIAVLVILLAAGCANRQPTFSESRIQSWPAAGAITGMASAAAPVQPFCLHIRYVNEFNYVYSENAAEAWVTDGACDVQGPRRSVSQLVLRWRYQYDSHGTQTCNAADSCVLSEKTPGEGRRLACVSASVRDGGQEAAGSTNRYACPY